MPDLADTIQKIFSPDGLLARKLPDYETRPGQQEMAKAVAAVLADESGGKVAVEAETGIGKTLAYLIPAVLSCQRVVVSTNTLNLQEQILNKEIPFIRRHINPELTAICVKGRQNYLCLYRWRQFASSPQQRLFESDNDLKKIVEWLKVTSTGDRAELTWLPDDSQLWREISANPGQCLGSRCPDETGCYISILRRKAAASRLLIVNHHLFFSDLALRRNGFGEVLPRYESVIFDEAHHLENVATRHFGLSFSLYQLIDLANDIEKLAEAGLAKKDRDRILQATRALVSQANTFAAIFPAEKGRFPLQEFIDNQPAWDGEILALKETITRLTNRLQAFSRTNEVWPAMEMRCAELLDKLETIIADPFVEDGQSDPFIRWFERRDKTVALVSSPIAIAALLQESLYTNVKSCVFTSGTLTAGGRFSYFMEQLGLDEDTETISLPSPFDYRNRTLLYIPEHSAAQRFPEPRMDSYSAEIEQQILKIISASSGRALVLFTSFNAMKKAHLFLADRLPFQVLVQGESPKNILLENFQQQTDSVLLAVASFWEGVNVPGESLSCVIIDKLPFEVPSDPVIMARTNMIRQAGGNPFFDFQVPRAILALRQGVGRLIRASTDRGLLAILDIRLFTKSYGRQFRASLPPSPVTRSLDDVGSFFNDPVVDNDSRLV